jgi:hypothetical protein
MTNHPPPDVVWAVFLFLPALVVIFAIIFGMACFFSWVGEQLAERRDRKNEQLAHQRHMELETLRANAEQEATLCGCAHDLAHHNRDTDDCRHKQVFLWIVRVQCTCQRYTGRSRSLEDCLAEITEMEV